MVNPPTFKRDFLASLLVLLDLHDREMSAEAQDVFFLTVADQPAAEVLAVMAEYQRAEWMPKPFDILTRLRARRPVVAMKALPAPVMPDTEWRDVQGLIAGLVRSLRLPGSSPRTPSSERS